MSIEHGDSRHRISGEVGAATGVATVLLALLSVAALGLLSLVGVSQVASSDFARERAMFGRLVPPAPLSSTASASKPADLAPRSNAVAAHSSLAFAPRASGPRAAADQFVRSFLGAVTPTPAVTPLVTPDPHAVPQAPASSESTIKTFSLGVSKAGHTWTGVKGGQTWSGVKGGQSWSGVKGGQSWSGVKKAPKSTAKQSTAKKLTAKKSTAKKLTAKKSTARKSTGSKNVRVRGNQPSTKRGHAAPQKTTGVRGTKFSPRKASADPRKKQSDRRKDKASEGSQAAGQPSTPVLASPAAATQPPVATAAAEKHNAKGKPEQATPGKGPKQR